MTVINSIADLRELASRRIPRAIFEYADRGSYDEITLRRNRTELDAVRLRQRVMVDVSKRSLATTLAGQASSMPLGIGPTGLTGLFYPDGEIHGLRAAAAAGIPFCLSTLSICSIEDLRAATSDPFWFQLYLMRDRAFNAELIERARAAACPVLVLTVDLQAMAVRRRDAKNGLSVPPRLTLKNVLDVLSKPRWIAGMLSTRRHSFGNLEGRMSAGTGMLNLSEWVAGQFDASATWKDAAWVRERWPGKLVLKGVLDAVDAREAAAVGADAVVVSNHGGRQLDGATSSIDVLPEVVAALKGRCEVLFDGGVMSGQDVLKAVALGARGCLIGKAFLYALAARGGAGVSQAIGIIRSELDGSMALTGVADIQQVDAGSIRIQPGA
jgi:L-lactate dehydrogenase (cytochrome)